MRGLAWVASDKAFLRVFSRFRIKFCQRGVPRRSREVAEKLLGGQCRFPCDCPAHAPSKGPPRCRRPLRPGPSLPATAVARAYREHSGAGGTSQGHDEQLVDGGLPSLVLLQAGLRFESCSSWAEKPCRLLGFRDLNTPCSHYVECPKASSFHLGLRPLGDEVSPLRSSVCKATLHETAEQSRVTRCDAPRLGGSCQGLPAPGTAVGLLT